MDYVIFDFGHTLVNKEIRREHVFRNAMSACGIDIPFELVSESYRAVDLFLQYSSVNIKTKIEREDFYYKYNLFLLRYLGCTKDSDRYLKSIFKEFSKPNKWILFDDVMSSLKVLSKKYRLGILSNWDPTLIDLVKENNILFFFDFIVSSAEIGIEKPDKAFFEHCLSKYNLNKEDIVYVGDSYNLDIETTNKLKIKNVLVDRYDYYKYSDCEKVQSLEELVKILK
ncbi:HAD family hydrolase [Candidatus Woesearchaeota archaeon]|nr:HAD family hydrolase [Candidatus Woesearchaeota archaeon]